MYRQGSLSRLCRQEEPEAVAEERLADSVSCNTSDVRAGEGEEDEHMKTLFDREIGSGHFKKSGKSSVLGDDHHQHWIQSSRSQAITWILKSRAAFRLQFQTVYMTILFFDRFLSRRPIYQEQSWAMQLLSVACLSLAAKMEEINPPFLSEYEVGGGYSFESKMIQRMELLVLDTLDWRMGSVTPFAFLPHIFRKLFGAPSPARQVIIMSRAARSILGAMKEINSIEYRPSVIAVAAIMAAAADQLMSTRQELECTMSPVSSYGFLDTEEVFACYNVLIKMLETKTDETQTDLIDSPDLSPNRWSLEGVLNNSSAASSCVTAKRRRLTSEDCVCRMP